MTQVEAMVPDLSPSPVAEPTFAPTSPEPLWLPMEFRLGVHTPDDVASVPGTSSSSERPTTPPSGSWDIVDEWGMDSFPASDPPANW